MVVLDTSFLIDMLRGKKETLKILNRRENLFTTQINMYEIVKGLFFKNISSSKFAEVFEMFHNIRVLPFDDVALIKSAEIFAELSRKGQEIHDFDCIIVGIALSRGINKVVTKNVEHFKRIKDIKVEEY